MSHVKQIASKNEDKTTANNRIYFKHAKIQKQQQDIFPRYRATVKKTKAVIVCTSGSYFHGN